MMTLIITFNSLMADSEDLLLFSVSYCSKLIVFRNLDKIGTYNASFRSTLNTFKLKSI